MTAGFVATGRFVPVFAVDNDADAIETYIANFGPEHVHLADIQDIDTFPQGDVVVGGPPCQGFSPLNRAGVGPERRELWKEYVRALRASQARIFVMENVPELLKSDEFRELREELDGEWSLRYEVLDAADYGVPQRRRRAIVIGSKDGPVPWPVRTHRDPKRPDLPGRPWRTFDDACRDLPEIPDGRDWHRARRPTEVSLRRYAAVPPEGGDRFDMQRELESRGEGHLVPRCWREKPTGTTDVFGRLWSDRPAVTLRTEFYKPEKGRYLHPRQDRPITIREGARLMSFPSDFVFPEHLSMTSVGRQIGNAVPPRLAFAIAKAIADVQVSDVGSPVDDAPGTQMRLPLDAASAR
jgi:DNA (cytosine-5)-methyltransferase 1